LSNFNQFLKRKMQMQQQIQDSLQINAEILYTDQLGVDRKQSELFLTDLYNFALQNNQKLNKCPIMGYKELDLYQLYNEVIALGGFNQVVKTVGTWSKIWRRLSNFDPSITDSSFRLKKNYEKYLLEYEFHKFPEHREQGVAPKPKYKKRAPRPLSPSTTSVSTIQFQSPQHHQFQTLAVGGPQSLNQSMASNPSMMLGQSMVHNQSMAFGGSHHSSLENSPQPSPQLSPTHYSQTGEYVKVIAPQPPQLLFFEDTRKFDDIKKRDSVFLEEEAVQILTSFKKVRIN